MSVLKRAKVGAAILIILAGVNAASALPVSKFEQEVAAISERVTLAPRAAQPGLEKLAVTYGPLTPQHQALLYEQLALAAFYVKDFHASRGHGLALEALGKQTGDPSMECLGVLYQVYGSWKLGKIAAAYALVDRAERFPQQSLSLSARVRTLLTSAQMDAEERYSQDALLAAGQAVQLARSSGDSAMLFTATHGQAFVALSTGNLPAAMKAMEQLLEQARQSAIPERRIRAKGMEFAVASYAGMTQRATQAVAECVRLIRGLQLNEALPGALVDYAGLQLRGKRYAQAVELAQEALRQGPILADRRLSNSAHFIHAVSSIYLGKVDEGKAEVERLFTSNHERAQLLAFLPEYAAALTHSGDVNASVQAAAIQRKLETEEALERAKEKEKAVGQPGPPVPESQAQPRASTRSAALAWTIAAIAVIALALLVSALYRRARHRKQAAGPA